MNSSIITSLFRAPLSHQHHAAGRLPTLPSTMILTPVKYCCRNLASRRSALSADERAAAIQRLNNTTSSGSAPPLIMQWEPLSDRNAIKKTFMFQDFSQAWAFMSRTALLAEKMDHHPEWFNVYNTVKVTLTTHDVDGVSEKDISMAEQMELYAKDVLPTTTTISHA